LRSVDSKSGYTLLEMMVVMSVVALISSLIITFTQGTGRAGLKATVMESVALFRRERLHAIMSGEDRHVALDERHRRFIGDSGGEVAIPEDVTVDLLGENEIWPKGRAVASFYSDGASSGAAVKFSREGIAYEVHVNWYTGGVTIKVL